MIIQCYSILAKNTGKILCTNTWHLLAEILVIFLTFSFESYSDEIQFYPRFPSFFRFCLGKYNCTCVNINS